MDNVALEVVALKEELLVLDYAKPEESKRKWYNPLNYKGAMIGLGYSTIWPVVTYSYLFLEGFDSLYDKYLPNGSMQDNIVGYTLKIPSEFVLGNIERLTRGSLDVGAILLSYLASWALAGHIIEKAASFGKKKMLKRK